METRHTVAADVAREPAGTALPARVEREVALRRTLAFGDLVAALGGILVAAVFGHGSLLVVFWLVCLLPAWIVLGKLHGLYDRDQRALRVLSIDEAPSVAAWAATGTAVVAGLLVVVPGAPQLTAVAAIRTGVAVAAAGVLVRTAIRLLWRRFAPPDRVAIVGSGAAAHALRRKIELFPDIHVTVVAEHREPTAADVEAPGWLAGVDRVLCAGVSDEGFVRALAADCRRRQIRLSIVPPLLGVFGTAVQLNHVADLPLIEYSTWHVARSTLLLKRVVDVLVGSVLLALALPLMAGIAVAVVIDSGRPVVFRQLRATVGGRPFWILKFRTMVANAETLLPSIVDFDELDDPVFKLAEDPRRTRVGRFLRRFSLDELPQLVNVVAGDMSLVGPRPEQVELVSRYEPEHRFRLAVRPGLTGPMQVYGRGRLTFEERLAVERDYVENLSLGRDLRILALTVSTIWSGRGAY